MALAIAVATLWPTPDAPQPNEGLCIICGSLGGIDFLSNIGLFVPLGVALHISGMPIRRVIAAGGLFSLTIEALQWQLIAGRDASLGDLLANTLGTAVGALAAAARASAGRPTPRIALRLALAWTVGLVVAGMIAGWALRPAPVDLRYWSQWVPTRYGYTPFTGTLLQLSLFGRPVPNGKMIDPTFEDQRYAAGLVEVQALVVPGVPGPGTMLIARAGNPLGEQFELAQRGSALLFRTRRNASRLALRSPVLYLPNALKPLGPASALDINARAAVSGAAFTLRDATGRESPSTVAFTLGAAWQTISPVEARVPALQGPVAALLLLAAALVLGWWALVALGWLGSTVWVATAGLLLLVAIPVAAGIAPGGAWETSGFAAGGALGLLFGRLSAARTSASGARQARSVPPRR